MNLQLLRIKLLSLLILFVFLNPTLAQDGVWGGSVSYYNPHTHDNVYFMGIQKVQLGSDGHYYGLARLDYSLDHSNGPSARRKKDFQGLGISFADWSELDGPMFIPPAPTIPVAYDDNIPVWFKQFGHHTVQYIWLRANSVDATHVHFNAKLRHTFIVGYRYSNDWLGLMWHLGSYHVFYDGPYINVSVSK